MVQSDIDTSQAIIPLSLLRQALRVWWLLVLGAVLGGAAGLLAHRVLPPIYQSQAVISAHIDFGVTGPLTDVEEDYMVLAVGGVIGSDEVAARTLQLARQAGYDVDRAALDQTTFLQRRFTDWLLIVRHTDPAAATALADSWGEAAWEVLQEALLHAEKAHQVQAYIDAQVTCAESLETGSPVGSACTLASAEAVRAEIDALTPALVEEGTNARGLVAGTRLAFSEQAQVPQRPVQRGRNSLALAGGLAGLLLTAVGVVLRPRR